MSSRDDDYLKAFAEVEGRGGGYGSKTKKKTTRDEEFIYSFFEKDLGGFRLNSSFSFGRWAYKEAIDNKNLDKKKLKLWLKIFNNEINWELEEFLNECVENPHCFKTFEDAKIAYKKARKKLNWVNVPGRYFNKSDRRNRKEAIFYAN